MIATNVEIADYRILAQYTTCCAYIDGEQLYACDLRTYYYSHNTLASAPPALLLTTVDSSITYADIPWSAVQYLNIIHGYMGHLRAALYHVSRGLNELYHATITGGANTTAIPDVPFALFVEEPCLEDYDDDGGPFVDDDDGNDIRCPTKSTPALIPGLFKTIMPDYTAVTGRVMNVDFDPFPLSMGYLPDSQLDLMIYVSAREGSGRFFKRADRIAPQYGDIIENVLNYPQLARETNGTKLRSLFAKIRTFTAPFNFEYRRPLVRAKFESEGTQLRYEDLVRFGRRVIDAVASPGYDGTISCLEQFYSKKSSPVGDFALQRARSLLTNLDRLTMMVDDDDGSSDDHFGAQTPHCYEGRKLNHRARAYLNYTVDVAGKRVCHPWEDDPLCETRYGGNHGSTDVSACIRRAYLAMQPIAEKIVLDLQYIVQSVHTRLATLQEFLRIAREDGSPAYRFPNTTECFDTEYFRTSLY